MHAIPPKSLCKCHNLPKPISRTCYLLNPRKKETRLRSTLQYQENPHPYSTYMLFKYKLMLKMLEIRQKPTEQWASENVKRISIHILFYKVFLILETMQKNDWAVSISQCQENPPNAIQSHLMWPVSLHSLDWSFWGKHKKFNPKSRCILNCIFFSSNRWDLSKGGTLER